MMLCITRVKDLYRFDADLDLDPTFHFDADLDSDPFAKEQIFYVTYRILPRIGWRQMRSRIRQIIRILFHNPVSYISHVSQRLRIAHSHLYPDLACHGAKMKGTVAWDSDGF
jgi:hypothetical protein